MADIYSELSIIVKLWGDRRMHPAIQAAKQHAEKIRDIPSTSALQTPEQQTALSEAVAFRNEHLNELKDILLKANPNAMTALNSAYETKSAAWEMMNTLATDANYELMILGTNPGPEWAEPRDALQNAYQEFLDQESQINTEASTQVLEKAALIGALLVKGETQSGSLATRFRTAADAVNLSSTKLLQQKLTNEIDHAEKVVGDISTFLDQGVNAIEADVKNTTHQALKEWSSSATVQSIQEQLKILQDFGLSHLYNPGQPAMQHVFNSVAGEKNATPLDVFKKRVEQVRGFRDRVSTLESTMKASVKALMETTEGTVKAKNREQVTAAQNRLAPLLAAFPNDPTLQSIKANLEQMQNNPNSALNAKMTPDSIDLSNLHQVSLLTGARWGQMDVFAERVNAINSEVTSLVDQAVTEMAHFVALQSNSYNAQNAELISEISALKTELATHRENVGQPPLGNQFDSRLEALSHRITDLETAVNDAAPNDFVVQKQALDALKACREEYKSVETEIHTALREQLQTKDVKDLHSLQREINGYLRTIQPVKKNDQMRPSRDKINSIASDLVTVLDQSEPVTSWADYQERKETVERSHQQMKGDFESARSDFNGEWNLHLLERYDTTMKLSDAMNTNLNSEKFQTALAASRKLDHPLINGPRDQFGHAFESYQNLHAKFSRKGIATGLPESVLVSLERDIQKQEEQMTQVEEYAREFGKAATTLAKKSPKANVARATPSTTTEVRKRADAQARPTEAKSEKNNLTEDSNETRRQRARIRLQGVQKPQSRQFIQSPKAAPGSVQVPKASQAELETRVTKGKAYNPNQPEKPAIEKNWSEVEKTPRNREARIEEIKLKIQQRKMEKAAQEPATKQTEPSVRAPTAAASTSATLTSTVNPDQLERAREYVAKRQSQMVKPTARRPEQTAVNASSAKLNSDPEPVTRPRSRLVKAQDQSNVTSKERAAMQQLRKQEVGKQGTEQKEFSTDTTKNPR